MLKRLPKFSCISLSLPNWYFLSSEIIFNYGNFQYHTSMGIDISTCPLMNFTSCSHSSSRSAPIRSEWELPLYSWLIHLIYLETHSETYVIPSSSCNSRGETSLQRLWVISNWSSIFSFDFDFFSSRELTPSLHECHWATESLHSSHLGLFRFVIFSLTYLKITVSENWRNAIFAVIPTGKFQLFSGKFNEVCFVSWRKLYQSSYRLKLLIYPHMFVAW